MIEAKIRNDLKNAMREKDSLQVTTLRSLLTSLTNYKITNQLPREEELSHEEEQKVLRSELKKRREAQTVYEENGRREAAANEKREGDIIESYLPEQLSDEELESIVDKAIEEQEVENMGALMASVMKTVKGRADGARVKAIVTSRLR